MDVWLDAGAPATLAACRRAGTVSHLPLHKLASRDEAAAYYLSTSSMGALPEDEREELRSELLDALADVEYRLSLEARAFTTVRT